LSLKRNICYFSLLFIIFVVFLTSCSENETTSLIVSEHREKAQIDLKKIIVKNKVLHNVEPITQFPELPRGCEITSLTMLLRFAGVDIDKMTLAQEISKVPYQKDGYFGNPTKGFVGNMYTYNEPGLSVYNEPIENLARKYLPNRIINLTGSSFLEIKEQLTNGKPVWVIVGSTFKLLHDENWETWKTSDGEIKITRKVHSVLITGYDEEFIYFNDPFYSTPNMKAEFDDFIASWNQFGLQAVSFE
jgi:uncharacterized protein YvpB